ncbi:MAG: TldD/PmbA family protein [Candidatus Pacebacteria bacterium]|nr:TldD/PmbA family protein [Candidatus Paceibacterota bacterium]
MNSPVQTIDPLTVLQQLVEMAIKSGASDADALITDSVVLGVSQRLNEREGLERSESRDLGLRVLVGKQQAIVSSTDLSSKSLEALVERAVAMAKLAPRDEYQGIADYLAVNTDITASDVRRLDLIDPVEPTVEWLSSLAEEAEEAARKVPKISNSDGANAGWSRTKAHMVSSNGFQGSQEATRHSLSVSVLAGSGTAMESDYDYSVSIYGRDIGDPKTIGRTAGERAVAKLNPQTVMTLKAPVVFENHIANFLLRSFIGAINGNSIARGTSFLKDQLGELVFNPEITIIDDPLRIRGFRSRLFDGDGLKTEARKFIDNGVLTSWMMDLRSAKQLGFSSTGHASRSTASPPSPSPSNLYFAPGAVSRADLIADIKQGFFVTGLMGFGVNGVTGDYSQGASGFWIENGEITYPVSGVTIAGNLKDMFRDLTLADDLEFRSGIDSPTARTDSLTIAGN